MRKNPERERSKRPLNVYAGLIGVFGAALGGLLVRESGRRRHAPLSARLETRDLVLLGAATHKLSRMITRDVVTMGIRAPFTKFESFLGYGEAMESEREVGGVRQVAGEMLSCPYCLDPWIALALLHGLELAPAPTRLVLQLFSASALADFLHVGYETTRTQENVLTLEERRREKKAG